MSPEEKFHEAVTAGVKAGDIGWSPARFDALYKRVGFNDTVSFGLLRRAVTGLPELVQLVMFRTFTD